MVCTAAKAVGSDFLEPSLKSGGLNILHKKINLEEERQKEAHVSEEKKWTTILQVALCGNNKGNLLKQSWLYWGKKKWSYS